MKKRKIIICTLLLSCILTKGQALKTLQITGDDPVRSYGWSSEEAIDLFNHIMKPVYYGAPTEPKKRIPEYVSDLLEYNLECYNDSIMYIHKVYYEDSIPLPFGEWWTGRNIKEEIYYVYKPATLEGFAEWLKEKYKLK